MCVSLCVVICCMRTDDNGIFFEDDIACVLKGLRRGVVMGLLVTGCLGVGLV